MVRICRTRSMPTAPMSSRRPTNGLTNVASALAGVRACGAEKISVVLMGTPSPERVLMAVMPAAMQGILTVMFLAIRDSSLPSFTISSVVVLTTSALTGPATMEQISLSTSKKSFPSFATRDGFVVTPSRIPQLAAFRISPTFAVSMKNFMPYSLRRSAPPTASLRDLLDHLRHGDHGIPLLQVDQ